jgi:molybdopterin adenylyltransferase
VIRTALIVLSDRAASGERADASLPAMRERLDGRFAIVRERVLADDPAALQAELIDLADSGAADLVLTSGGTGLAPRDRTPQATAPVLSRALAGVRHRTLIVNLPGSPKAVREALDVVTPVLEHAIRQLTGIANEHPEIG